MGSPEHDVPEPEGWTRRQLLAGGGSFVAAFLALVSQSLPTVGCRRQIPPANAQSPGESSPGAGGVDAGGPPDAGTGPQADVGREVDSSDAGPDTAKSHDAATERPPEEFGSWREVRGQFDATDDLIHMAGMLLATHPRPVREAIEEHRRGLDDNPNDYLFEHWARNREQLDEDAEQWAMEGAARYLGVSPANIALTWNTTSGLANVYNGIRIREDQEILAGYWNHWASEGSIEYRAEKAGYDIRQVEMPASLQEVTTQQLVDHLVESISPKTRVVATTWVHSNTGLKLPVGEIGRRIQQLNRGRSANNRILFCVDGVHGFGVEDATMEDLQCDFFIAGCHKWLFGPRGTGLVAASADAWGQAVPTVPTFSMSITQGRRFTPGGFHAFEHRWALHRAFEFHQSLGKSRVEERIHSLTDHLVEGLANMDHVNVYTPLDEELRAGIVTLTVDGLGTYDVLGHLRRDDIIGSVTPGDLSIPRLTPGLLNDHAEIDRVLESMAAIT
jgi:selenocysteine lyase/cysteine desulfurase